MTRTARAIVVCVRDEGLWLLEWIAYHRTIGFDRLFVASNDCTDGTDLMLDRLHDLGEVVHLPNSVPPGVSPQEAGCSLALAHPEMASVEWLLHIDIDEYLHVSAGAGQIDDLLAAAGPCDCIAVSWRMFGSAGRRTWDGGSVLESNIRSEGWLRRGRSLQKCLFRPEKFASIYSHMPKDPVSRDIVLKNPAGAVMPNDALFAPRQARHRSALVQSFSWAVADIHHYAIRALDVFLLKNIRGDGLGISHQKYLRGSSFWKVAERNEVEDTAILRHLPALRRRLDTLRGDQPLADLERQAFAAFATLRQRVLIEDGRFGWNDADVPVLSEVGP